MAKDETTGIVELVYKDGVPRTEFVEGGVNIWYESKEIMGIGS